MANLRVDDFRTKLRGGGARANMFEVMVGFPTYAGGNTETANFMVRSAQLPGSIIGLVEVPFRGRIIKLAGDRTFEPWTITVYNDTSFDVRGPFERWSEGLNEHIDNIGTQANNSGIGGYATNMYVNQLDQAGSVVMSYELRNCFPSNIGPIELDYAQVGEVETFQVTIEYDYWVNRNTGGDDNLGTTIV